MHWLVSSRAMHCVSLILLLTTAKSSQAQGEAQLQARYQVSIAGFVIGNGSWTVDLDDASYTMAASGEVSGFLRAFSRGSGNAAASGLIRGNRLQPSAFAMRIKSRNKLDEVRMKWSGGAVKSLTVDPPVEYGAGRVALTEAHKRGVLDIISAGVIPGAGANGVAPAVCRGTGAIFDGRQRFELTLWFKRTQHVRTDHGYEGAVAVCGVTYNPTAGYEKDKYAHKFLRDSRDIEIWYAPIAGTRLVAMYRINVPTVLGPAMLYATHFVVTLKRGRSAERR